MLRRTTDSASRTRFGRPSPAMIVACMALFAALGGVGYAAAKIGSEQIKDNSVQGKDIKNATLKSSDVKDGSLASADVKDSGLTGVDIATQSIAGSDLRDGTVGLDKIRPQDRNDLRGPAGAKGDTGPAGAAGSTGPRGPSELRVLADANSNVAECALLLVVCPNIRTRTLGAGNWLIQAKFVIDNDAGAPTNPANRCGIVTPGASTLLDSSRFHLAATPAVGESQAITLSGVLTGVADGTLVAVRCNERPGEDLAVEDLVLTALQVETIITAP